MEAEIYALVVRRLAEHDHGWGKPFAFPALFVLDHAVPGIENPGAVRDGPALEYHFDEALRTAVRAKLPDLPTITCIRDRLDVYEAERQGPIQVRDGGAFIALGPVVRDGQSAVVGAFLYCGHLWARWMRYHLEQEVGTWRIHDTEELAVS
jgi:hypothetical protein